MLSTVTLTSRISKVLAIATLLGVLLSLTPFRANAEDAKGNQGNPNPGVVPLNARYAGLSYNEWAARWWQWAWRTATLTHSPVFDSTGEDFAVGQSGPVWFLTWAFWPVTRHVTLPEGTALLLTATNHDPFLGNEDKTLEELTELALTVFDGTIDPEVIVDGVPIKDLTSYQVLSVPYIISFPADNLFGYPAGEYGPSINAGNYLLLTPLPVGEHTIQMRWGWETAGNVLDVDVVYQITVVPHRAN